jgi:secreted trypsin-like serine protease
MLCATGDNGACDKNSGGPMVINNRQNGGGDRYILTGIVSWGIGCDETNKLSVYTSVLSHVGWIKRSCGIPN